MKPWIKRSPAACSHRHHHGGMMSEANATQLRERVIGKATRELSLELLFEGLRIDPLRREVQGLGATVVLTALRG